MVWRVQRAGPAPTVYSTTNSSKPRIRSRVPDPESRPPSRRPRRRTSEHRLVGIDRVFDFAIEIELVTVDQLFGNRGAVHVNQGQVLARAVAVDRSGHQFFATPLSPVILPFHSTSRAAELVTFVFQGHSQEIANGSVALSDGRNGHAGDPGDSRQ